MIKFRKRLLAVVTAGTLAAATLGLGVASPALAAKGDNPSTMCSSTGNGGVTHGGCTSTAAQYGSADLENLPYLSQSALVSTCGQLPYEFIGMASSLPYPFTLGTQTFYDPVSLGLYVFHDIFGPNMSTCTAVLAADHATIANPGPEGPYDVYYTGGHGGNTTYAPGVPADLAELFSGPPPS
jgi:hypothetical protein